MCGQTGERASVLVVGDHSVIICYVVVLVLVLRRHKPVGWHRHCGGEIEPRLGQMCVPQGQARRGFGKES